uniref:Ecdysteroid UDP-glucosyltransferase n=1 Tax=Epinotia aporema granulovirus TaxID=166056 RepID=Q91KX3_9BBAC|nr:ecdysteroid UDP-glycosyltransferase [Epinotia aporema granulovirus]
MWTAIVVVLASSAAAHNILCVFPTPAYSHNSVFNAYMDELVKDGHNVTVITTMPRNITYITQVDCSLPGHYFQELVKNSTMIKKRGVVADETTVTKENYMGLVDMVVREMQHENVREFLQKDQMFDLVVCEAYISYILVFGYLFKAPVIQFSSGYGLVENFETMGIVERNPNTHPNLWRSSQNASYEAILHREWAMLERAQHDIMRDNYGTRVPTMKKLRQRVLMLFINVPAIFDNNRPVTPMVQYFGGMHLRSPTKDVSFLDKHKNVVYVSFGSSIDAMEMDSGLIGEFVRAFARVPYMVLWKISNNVRDLYNVSSNVIIREWFPQRDILNHANVKLFITQGGVQSTDEAIDSCVPLLGIPMVGDQFYNTGRYVSLKIGQKIDVLRLEQEELALKIMDMVQNHSYYKNNLIQLKSYINDNSMTSLKRSVIHQFVLRNKIFLYYHK